MTSETLKDDYHISIPPSLKVSLANFLNITHENVSSRQGGSANLFCDNKIMKTFQQEFPFLCQRWVLNGSPLKTDQSRVQVIRNELRIMNLSPLDTGVYECRLEDGLRNITIGFIALHVTTSLPTVSVEERKDLQLECNSKALDLLLSSTLLDLIGNATADNKSDKTTARNTTHIKSPKTTIRQWLHNGTFSPFFPPSLPASHPSPDMLTPAELLMSGEWVCVVSHLPTNRSWVTAWILVQVRRALTPLEAWWKAVLAYPIAVAGVGFAFLVLCILASIFVARKGWTDINLEERYMIMKERLSRRRRSRTLSIDDKIASKPKELAGRPSKGITWGETLVKDYTVEVCDRYQTGTIVSFVKNL